MVDTQVSSVVFFFSSRRRHTRFDCDWSSDVCSSDLAGELRCRLGYRRLECARARALARSFHQPRLTRGLRAGCGAHRLWRGGPPPWGGGGGRPPPPPLLPPGAPGPPPPAPPRPGSPPPRHPP